MKKVMRWIADYFRRRIEAGDLEDVWALLIALALVGLVWIAAS